jgi:pimeloyl-ACP methyl ester carboxylesterase
MAFIGEIGGGRVHLVGHDLGAEVAWIVAGAAPGLVQSLTVVSTPHPRALTRAFVTSDQAFRSWYISFLQLPVIPELVFRAGRGAAAVRLLQQTGLTMPWAREYVNRLLASPGALRGAINWYRAFPLTPRLVFAAPPVSVPTMYVWSNGDSVVTRTAARRTARYVTGPYDFRMLDGVSRWIPEQAPAQLAELILAHARTYPVSAPPP